MHRTRTRSRLIAALALVASLAALAACGPTPAVEARWPRADRERVVAAAPVRPTWPFTGVPASLEGSDVPPPVLVPLPSGPLPATLALADVVFEQPAPGGTRLSALFQSGLPAEAVAVAPATAADVTLAAGYQARLAYSGELPAALPPELDDIGPRSLPDAYDERGGTTWVDVNVLASATGARADETTPAFTFSEAPPAGIGSLVSTLTVPYPGTPGVQWRWEPASGTYLRAVGQRLVSAGNKPVRAVNVVLLWARPSARDASATLDLRFGGRASVFRGARKLIGTWRLGDDGRPQLRDERGEAMRLAPGNTWVELMPNALDIVVQ